VSFPSSRSSGFWPMSIQNPTIPLPLCCASGRCLRWTASCSPPRLAISGSTENIWPVFTSLFNTKSELGCRTRPE